MATCIVCEKAIKEATSKSKGQDSVFCEGECQDWMHRQCVGMPIPVFKALTKSKAPFLCLYCSNNKIQELQQTVVNLQNELNSLKSVSAPAKSPTWYAKIVQTMVQSDEPQTKTRSSVGTPLPPVQHHKFNVVVYGVNEKPKGSPKHTRLLEDIKDVSVVFNKLDPSISSQSIQDCTRLGKYSEDRCRPLLVKLSRSCEVSSLLSKRRKLKGTPRVSIKPDMSPEERKIDSLLMRKRWELSETMGIAKENIKIRGKSIYVNNSKFGSIVNCEFKPSQVTQSLENSNSEASTASNDHHSPLLRKPYHSKIQILMHQELVMIITPPLPDYKPIISPFLMHAVSLINLPICNHLFFPQIRVSLQSLKLGSTKTYSTMRFFHIAIIFIVLIGLQEVAVY